jgi:hypothetical protein
VTVGDELKKIREEMVVVYFKVSWKNWEHYVIDKLG